MGIADQEYLKIHSNQFRKNTFDALRSFGSKAIQLKYQKDVPFADVIDEICLEWTDNYGRDNKNDFRILFNESEQKILDEFDRIYTEVCADAVNKPKSLNEFVGTVNWLRLYKAARSALKKLHFELPEE